MPAILALLLAAPLPPQPDGTVKGRLVWPAAAALPDNPEVRALRDAEYMLVRGPVLLNELVVRPKGRGIKNAAFYLAHADDPLRPLGRPVPGKAAEVTMPHGQFVPRVAVVAPGQAVTFRNETPVAHALRCHGGSDVNVLLMPEKSFSLGPLEPRLLPTSVSCPIHPWMRGYVIASPGPYFAVTDHDGAFTLRGVPKGKYRLIGWHERVGWVFPRHRPGAPPGQVIEVKERGAVDLGRIERREPVRP